MHKLFKFTKKAQNIVEEISALNSTTFVCKADLTDNKHIDQSAI